MKVNRNDEAVYLTIPQVQQKTNLCRSTIMRLAAEANAMIRVGRAIRINSSKLLKYIDKEYSAME